jgi:hypothetical protein
MTGKLNQIFIGINFPIVDIQCGISGLGPVALDSNGTITFWTSGMPNQYHVDNIIGFSHVQSPTSSTQSYVVVNVGTAAVEILVDSIAKSFTPGKTYTPASGTTFTSAIYTMDHNLLIVATNTSTVQSYNCSTGLNSGVNFPTGSAGKILSQYYSSTMTLLTQNNDIYTFNPTDFTTNLKIGNFLFYFIANDKEMGDKI